MHLRMYRTPFLGALALSYAALFGFDAAARAQTGEHLVHLGSSAPGLVTVTYSAPIYHLSFVGDETLDYQINVADHPVQRGYLRVYEASSACWPVYDGGVGYRRQDGLATGPQYLSQYTTITNHYKTSDSVVLEFQDNADGVLHHRRYTYRLSASRSRSTSSTWTRARVTWATSAACWWRRPRTR